MRNIFLFSTIFLLGSLSFGAGAAAQSAQSRTYCERAENTADVMACVKKRHEEAQKRLNVIYDRVLENESKVVEIIDNEALADSESAVHEEPAPIQGQPDMVRGAQQNWIAYRDQECDWERKLEDTESLKRIRQLSCLTALTEQRSDVLSLSLDLEEEGASRSTEHSTTPRWMNALAADDQSVFWKYNDYLRADINCDGVDEEIMNGVKIEPRAGADEDESSENFALNSVVAITQNSATGRPKATMFYFSVAVEASEEAVCDSGLRFSVVDYEPVPVAAVEGAALAVEAEVACKSALQINDGKCASKLIHWDGAAYNVLPVPAP